MGAAQRDLGGCILKIGWSGRDHSTTIRAIAYASGAPDSAVASATYTIGSGPAWYDTSWTNRKAITIDHTKVSGSSGLSSFPMLFSVTDANLKTVANGGSGGKSDGTDIFFTASDGVTKLDHELEAYNPGTGQTIAWVRIPSLSTTSDTVIYVYYGNPSAADQQNKTGVWDSNYKGVWHLPNGSALSANDSTGGNNGTNYGATAATGQIDGGASFNGSSQYISANLATSATTNVTMSVWVKWNGTNQESLIAQNGAAGNGWGLRIGGSAGGCGQTGGSVSLLFSGITCNALGSTYTLTSGQWAYIALTLRSLRTHCRQISATLAATRRSRQTLARFPRKPSRGDRCLRLLYWSTRTSTETYSTIMTTARTEKRSSRNIAQAGPVTSHVAASASSLASSSTYAQ